MPAGDGISFIPQANLEPLDGVGQRAGIEFPQPVQVLCAHFLGGGHVARIGVKSSHSGEEATFYADATRPPERLPYGSHSILREYLGDGPTA